MSFIVAQFGHPRGLVGRLVGAVMAYENRERNGWAIRLLDVQPSDRVLEIGFGPGLAIADVARIAVHGFVAGVDQSAVMLRQAAARNAAAIRSGRVELRQGSAGALPYADNTFDTVFAVNSLHHWPDPVAGLQEARRVLKPGGLLAVTEQPRSARIEPRVREIGDVLAQQLVSAGFQHVRLAFRPMRPASSICALAIKAHAQTR